MQPNISYTYFIVDPMTLKISLLFVLAVAIVFAAAITTSSAQIQSIIPDEIRQNILFWAQGDADDQTLVTNIQVMIDDDLISIPEVERLESVNQGLRNVVAQYDLVLDDLRSQITSDDLTISVHNNKQTYGPGDNIIIFGFVSHIVDDHEVGIVISDSMGRILAIAKIPPNTDGSYAFLASDPVFRELGEYSVHVYYGGRAYSDTTYVYNPGG